MAKKSKKRAEDDEDEVTKDKDEIDDKQTPEEEGDEGEESQKKKRKRKRKRSKKTAEEGDDTTDTAAAAATGGSEEDETSRTVFVEGVPYDTTPEKVAECLQQHAKIERSDMTELRFPTWQDSGRMRGYGHVVFATRDILQKVLNVSQSGEKMWMGRRYLSLQQARPKGMGMNNVSAQSISEPSKTIMIKSLDYDAVEDDIINVMKQFGAIVEGGVRIARNFQTRQNKGFAYVEYEDLESAKNAMERQLKQTPPKPLYILNRACVLDYDEGRVKGSFKTASGKLWSREYKDQASDKQDRPRKKDARTK